MLSNEDEKCQVEESFDITSIWEFKVHFEYDGKITIEELRGMKGLCLIGSLECPIKLQEQTKTLLKNALIAMSSSLTLHTATYQFLKVIITFSLSVIQFK